MSATTSEQPSPWRAVFEQVRAATGGRRDEHGVVGSINWLRKQMAAHGANPNVVRNIIYRDKGRPSDKRVLFDLLNGLWEGAGNPPLQVPELEVLLSAGGAAEQEIAQLLGRDKRRAYRIFVSGVRGGAHPKMLVTGRPGSGKTVLLDYVQQALELPPKASDRIIRLEFSNPDLGSSLARLADTLGVSEALFEAKLVKVGLSSAFAVQADAQADVARLLVAGMRELCEAGGRVALLLHLSQSLASQDALGAAQLRLNTEEVPRVTAAEWLWMSLLAPMSALPELSMLVTMAEAPLRVKSALGAFEGPLKLSPPTPSEAKRFVRSKLPHLSAKLQDELAKQAGRSFEDLRILTLLAEVREPNPASALLASETSLDAPLEALSNLALAPEAGGLRDFLSALAVLSLPEGPHFSAGALAALGQEGWQEPGALARAFLDAVPTASGETQWRCFSRQLGRALRRRLADQDPARYRRLHLAASRFYEPEALAEPSSEAAARYLQHLFEARDWQGLKGWMARHSARQSLIHGMWQAAQRELAGAELEAVAFEVARYYVRLASYHHPEARAALALLEGSSDSDVRAWTQLKRAEGAIHKGRYEDAERLLESLPEIQDATLRADAELARANIARWRGELARAARCIEDARPLLGPKDPSEGSARALVRAKIAVWSGLIAKDRGDLSEALTHFDQVESSDGLVRARQAFQKGDVQARLGRFDAALRELTTAVHLAEDCEAPVQERARYLARRARVLRKQGEFEAAASDFGRSLALLADREGAGGLGALELAFERAKVHDERALLLLARGHYDEAVLQFEDNLAVFARYERECHVDASFRRLRSAIRLGLAYWGRGAAQPYTMPFVRGHEGAADLEQAQRLAEDVRAAVAADPNRSERYGPLYTQTLLVAALVGTDPKGALGCAEEAFAEARFAYQRGLYGAFVAAARLRAGQPEAALEASSAAQLELEGVKQGKDERGDLGLLAWLVILELQSRLAGVGGARAAADSLGAALSRPELARYHEALLRAFGEAAQNVSAPEAAEAWQGHAGLHALLGLGEALPLQHLRLPDALVARWRALSGRASAVAAD